MIDWNAVFETLPSEFSLDTISAHETVGGKSRAYVRQMTARWSKEGRIKRTGRGMYQKN
jgi:predicted transcriptional regulator of viral defense system